MDKLLGNFSKGKMNFEQRNDTGDGRHIYFVSCNTSNDSYRLCNESVMKSVESFYGYVNEK